MSYSIATPQVTQNAGDRAYLTLQNQDACIFWNEERPGADEVFRASFLSCCDRISEVRLTRTVKVSQLSRQFSSRLRQMLRASRTLDPP